jgi:hypothetical protein
MIKKRGQFFILAALIIAIVLVGLVSVKNRVELSKDPENFYDLSEEIKYETDSVIDYGIFQGGGEDNLNDFINLSVINLEERDPDTELIILYGDKDSLTYESSSSEDFIIKAGGKENTIEGTEKEVTSNVELDLGDGRTINKVIKQRKKDVLPISGTGQTEGSDEVTINLNGIDYDFDVREGKNFYMIMRKKVGEEVLIDVR